MGLLVLILGIFQIAHGRISDERLCADAECKTVIGTGRTVIKYFAKDEGMLSFSNNKPVKIFSKGAGSNPDLWGVMIDGRRGYVNKGHVQETRVHHKNLEFKVPTEFYKVEEQETAPKPEVQSKEDESVTNSPDQK